MTTIKKLIKLDFYAMKSLSRIMVVFLIIPIVLSVVVNKITGMLSLLTFLVFMLNVVFAITEKSNFSKLYGVLPIKKNAHIIGRYVFSMIVLLCGTMLAFAIFSILSLFGSEAIRWTEGLEGAAICIVVAIFFISIQYPFYYRLSYTKASLMAVLPYILCFAIGAPCMQYIMKDATIYAHVMSIVTYFQNHTVIFMALACALSILFIGISCFLSIQTQKKEG